MSKAVKGFSVESRQLAGEAILLHQQCKKGAEVMVFSAIACGLKLMKAKEILPHGAFEGWREKYIGKNVSEPTVQRYKRLAEEMSGSLKSVTVTLLQSTPAQELTPDRLLEIAPHLYRQLEGRSLSQLYEAFGIIKPRKRKGQKAIDRAKDEPEDPEKRKRYWCQLTFTDFFEVSTRCAPYVEVLEPEERQQATEQTIALLEALTGGRVEIKF